jgi:hypothetical protein
MPVTRSKSVAFRVAFAIAAFLVTGCGSAAAPSTGAQGASSGGIAFEPSTFSCDPSSSASVASSATLPSSVKDEDRPGLTWQLDGATIDFGSGPLSKPTFLLQSDGSWRLKDTGLAAYLCLSQIGTGISQGPNSIGPHTIKVLDASGKALAEGAFTVIDESGAASLDAGGGGTTAAPLVATAAPPVATAAPPVATAEAAASPGVSTGDGSLHYEVTGSDTISGDLPFAGSFVHSPSSGGLAGKPFDITFQTDARDIAARIKIPDRFCAAGETIDCGTVQLGTTTPPISLMAVGNNCTWDTSQLTANGGTGSVVCTNVLDLYQLSKSPDTMTLTFTYSDPAPILR